MTARTGSRGHVVVVGGGLAGITAALAVADEGASVTLLERRRWLGGLTWSFRRAGRTYDNGQHVFLRCCTAYRALLDRLGVADRVVLQRRMDVPVLRPGRRPARLRRVGLPAPLHLAPALARYRPLPFRARVGVAPAMRALGRLDLADPALDAETFGDWLDRHHQGPQAVEALYDLITLPTVNLPASEASLLLAATVFQVGLLASAGAADIGWSAVPLAQLHDLPARRALGAAGASVRLGVAVRSVDPATAAGPGPRWSVTTDHGTERADAVVVALPPEPATAVLPPGAGVPPPGGLGHVPIVNVHVVVDRPVADHPLQAVLGSPLQYVFAHPTGDGGQRLVVSLSGADRWIGRPGRELIETMTLALAEVFPAMAGARVLDAVVTREHQATIRGVPGTHHLRPPTATALPGLTLAGAWTDTGWPSTMEGAVRSGTTAAALALAALGAGDAGPEDTAPGDAGPEDTAPGDAGPGDAAQHDAAPGARRPAGVPRPSSYEEVTL